MVFTVALKQEQYPTYVLSDREAQSRLEVVPERGGMVTRWRIQGQEILYLDEERFADSQKSVRGGIPILFPICGNLPDNTYTHRGKQYTLKQHGLARDLPWHVTEQDTQDSASITLVLNSNNTTYTAYPFDFQLVFTYRLRGNSLEIQQRITNQSQESMPFSVGLHPYFLISDKNKLDFDIPASQYRDQLTQETHSFSGDFDFDQEEIDVAFTSITASTAGFTGNQRRYRVSIEYSELYSTLVFWTVKGKQYVCLEPWSAPRNALNTGEQLTTIDPGSSYEASVKMRVSYY
ncbi:MAG: aldose epimerase [Cyanophyceae cyanobacterium]